MLTRQLAPAAVAAAQQLDGHVVGELYRTKDVTSPAYREQQRALRAVQQQFGLSTDIYTLHLEGDRTRFGISTKTDPLMDQVYDLKPQMVGVFAGEGVAQTGLYRSPNGWWVSAFAPVQNPSGEVVALVEADFNLDPFVQEMGRRVLWSSAVALLMVLMVALPVGVFIAYAFIRPLRTLQQQSEAISQGKVDSIHPDLDAPGEVGALAESFDRAMASVRYYMHRLQEEQRARASTPGEETVL